MKYDFLQDFPGYVNILEKGLHSATEDSDQQEKDEEEIKEKLDQKAEQIMKNQVDLMMKEIQPALDKTYERLESIENNVAVQKEMTKIGLKKVEDCVYEETSYIRDKIGIIKDIAAKTDAEPDVVEEEGGRSRCHAAQHDEEGRGN
eukprot:14575726-Heterocapsa_arctica.AAC.1